MRSTHRFGPTIIYGEKNNDKNYGLSKQKKKKVILQSRIKIRKSKVS